MERLKQWWIQAPPRQAPRLAWFYLIGGVFYFWWVLQRASSNPEPGRLITGVLLGIFLLAQGLGSVLPEDRGGAALRGATRWLVIPMFVGLALILIEISRQSGAQTALGLVILVVLIFTIPWFIRRYRASR